jgi:uncharacterized protein (UPF0212 family)
MRSLYASELLNVWEWGLSQSPIQRALTLLSATCPELSSEQLVNLSIGQRDGLLLALREQMFGPQLVSLAVCPHCGDRLELTFAVSDIRIPPPAEPIAVLSLKTEEYQVQFRLPTSLDLSIVGDQQDLARMRQQLLDRCLLSAQHNGGDIAPQELPAAIVEAVLQEMEQADPQANVQLSLSCPACDHQWQAIFDVMSFFWSEIQAWAQRLLLEVHTLASAYGWREMDILAMSPQRRQLYLEMIGR